MSYSTSKFDLNIASHKFKRVIMERIRIVSAASLFDGHDVSINIMRRLLQSKGVEVIHLGHNRSAKEVVDAAIQEDAHAICLSSYQGGHVEYFSYVRELLNQSGADNIRIFGGGGGVITPPEIALLESRGVTKIYSPQDGAKLGLDGIIDDIISKSQHITTDLFEVKDGPSDLSFIQIAKTISKIENEGFLDIQGQESGTPVFGITGTGGAGKSSLIDELLLRFHRFDPSFKVALISVDPTRKKSQGALLGDRIRLGSASYDQFFVRSLATRNSKNELSPQIQSVVKFLKTQSFNLIIIETSGIGQASDEITAISDLCAYVMTPEYGASSQLEKIEMLGAADFVVLNKFEKPRSEDALRDIKKQVRREKGLAVNKFSHSTSKNVPVFPTIASNFNDNGVNALFYAILEKLDVEAKNKSEISSDISSQKVMIIPPERSLYLREIATAVRDYNQETKIKEKYLYEYESLLKAKDVLTETKEIDERLKDLKEILGESTLAMLEGYERISQDYLNGDIKYNVRGKQLSVKSKFTSLSGNQISKVALPNFISLSDRFRFLRKSNIPGYFPYAAGIFPSKRTDEDPKRMFAGEGGPLRTNKRFHYLSEDSAAKRLSTAFDSVTLYGEDPAERPDIFGKIGEAGVNIATLDDMKDLFSGFDLTAKNTSVSMTINGPAPIILAMYMSAAIEQKLDGADRENIEKMIEVMQSVRGTVQADILKEDQAQNTCIYTLDFALKLMGDVQEYFCKNLIKNYYTVSISGYHIAEAGANPITQVAFTLANGFTYLEYYLSRGMQIDEFCENLSFFFSNGLDPEYSVIGRVARKIWAVTLRDKYGANTKSQKFKYHIQTSGRSLHAQEIDFNDIRTTLQAFLALSDNCNSLHTNAYDEAITTPTEESVRRAMAIQLIINREFGINQSDNPLQGSYLIEELADIVEDAVLSEFERISDKGGVLGAMESMYQRSKIQEESLYYEQLKDSGELPIVGINTFLSESITEEGEIELSRSSDEEKMQQIHRLNNFKKKNRDQKEKALAQLEEVALNNENIFEELLSTVRYCSLGEISNLLFEIGGKYRRNV
jgi:isobutyryl-CoA mutase